MYKFMPEELHNVHPYKEGLYQIYKPLYTLATT